MPKRKTQFANNEIYHIIIRSVGDTPIFIDEDDHFRGIFSLYEFNNSNKITIWNRRRDRKRFKNKIRKIGVRSESSPFLDGRDIISLDKRDVFVEILAFVIMPNHIHLIVRQLSTDGISRFMQKFGGLAWYFNNKYSRKGHLFCTYRSIHIENNEQLRNVFIYVHCNAISLIEPGWKKNGIKNPKKVIEFLRNYRWSSYLDYIGIDNFRSVSQRDFLLEFLGGLRECMDMIDNWVKYKSKKGNFDFEGIDLE
jgi:putative transposase